MQAIHSLSANRGVQDSSAKTSALAAGRITASIIMKREGKIPRVIRVLNNLGTRSSLVAQKYY